MRRGLALALLALCAPACADTLQLAWLRDGEAVLMQLDERGVQSRAPLPRELRAPLGSLWKLFVQAYVVERGRADEPYRCTGASREEVYCCDAGESIGRDAALVKSCGLYFAPARLGIAAQDWRAFWRDRPAWLADLAAMRPETQVPVHELLETLRTLPRREHLRSVLLDVVLQARDPEVRGQLGAQWRVKSWSWHADASSDGADDWAAPGGRSEAERIGGFAGWLVDGTAVWAQGAGTSQRVLATHARALATLPPTRTNMDDADCVEVRMFARYPIAAVEPAARGPLHGDFTVRFANANTIGVQSRGELVLHDHAITARLTREEYVARVLDREAAATPPAAARALAVAIRSYLLQNAAREGECLRIDDSSATQRVAPRPASAAAREVAAWTSDLVLAGQPVSYHLERAEPGKLAWTQAVAQAQAGRRYDEILAAAYPRATLQRWDAATPACQPLAAAQAWLAAQRPRWRETLDREPGHIEAPDVEVCKLASGRPHVDRAARRIHVRGLASQQDRLDLAHEYLHLAFEAHPSGQDEAYVEALARRLLLE